MRRALNASFASNVVLLAVRVAIAAISGSLSLAVATLDAILDVISSGEASQGPLKKLRALQEGRQPAPHCVHRVPRGLPPPALLLTPRSRPLPRRPPQRCVLPAP